MLDEIPNARLALVGSGPSTESLKEYFKGYPVVFTGPLNGKLVFTIFKT